MFEGLLSGAQLQKVYYKKENKEDQKRTNTREEKNSEEITSEDYSL